MPLPQPLSICPSKQRKRHQHCNLGCTLSKSFDGLVYTLGILCFGCLVILNLMCRYRRAATITRGTAVTATAAGHDCHRQCNFMILNRAFVKLHTVPSLFVVACWQQIDYMIYDLLNRIKSVIYKALWFEADIKLLFDLAKQVDELNCAQIPIITS